MIICQINAVNNISSTGRTCKEFLDFVNGSSNDTCYTFFAVGKEDEYSFKFGNILDRKIHALFSRISGKQAFYSKIVTHKMIKKMKQLKVDACLLRNTHSNFVNLPMLFKYFKKSNTSVIIHLDDCWYFTGKCTHFFLSGCFKWKELCGDCPQLKKDIPSWFVDTTSFALRKKKKWYNDIKNISFVGVSDWITKEASESYPLKGIACKTIYNWIDLNIFKPKPVFLSKKKTILGVSSYWSKNKGIDMFFKLSDLLTAEYQIVLVGDYDRKFENQKSNVIFVGSVNTKEKLASYYSSADIFLNFSKQESFGKVAAEAISCGTPVVCFDTTANAEVVKNCGKIMPLNASVEEIAEAISEVLKTNKADWIKLCTSYAKSHFDYKTNAKMLLDFIHETKERQ